ncbi:DUF3899 domain-containing protein [Pontibacillus yanchengensis]|nr:DUF3899 domain-containing protein [Pontibacillus yanchengensis]
MALFLNKWWFLGLNVALSFGFFFIWAPMYDLFHYINSLFYVSYFYVMISLLMIVIKGKFLDAITYSFRRFNNRMSKDRDYLDDWEQKPLPSQMVRPSVLKMFIFQGVALTVGMLGLLTYFYQAL